MIQRPNKGSVEPSLWKIVVETGRRAPFWGLVTLEVAALVVVIATTVGIMAIQQSSSPDRQERVISLVLGHTGLGLLTIAALLHQVTQRPEWRMSSWIVPFYDKPNKLHAVMLALPVMAFAAGILIAASVTMLIQTAIAPVSPEYLFVAVVYASFILFAARTVRDTTRFLFRHATEQAEAASRAQSEATRAQLSALQAQMNPHFLFNALNTVASLIRTRPEMAERTVENLAMVLRTTLDRSRKSMTTVGEEIEFLEAYLSVEAERFGERLRVAWALDPRCTHLPIPPMTLQPLVENALKHGVGNKLGVGELRISSRVDGDHFVLMVEDNGNGFSRGFREGTGLSNLRERLHTLYGDPGALALSQPGQPARASVTIPIDAMTAFIAAHTGEHAVSHERPD